MSARMLRRALRQREAVEEALDEEEDVDDAAASKKPAGLFSVLGAQVSDGEEIEDEEEDVGVSLSPATSKSGDRTGEADKNKSAKKKKKKKKKGGPTKKAFQEEGGGDDILSKLLEGMTVQKPQEKEELSVTEKMAAVMVVDPKNLRPEDELRQLFGSKVINSVRRSEESARLRRQRNAGRNVVPLRNGRKCLVVPMDNWPRWEPDLSMELGHVKDGVMTFRYVYSEAYIEIQKEYEMCVSSHDPNTIASLLLAHPYHAASLLALADVYKRVGEHQQSSFLLERCLYALECAWHPLFDPLGGKCRLEYSCSENQPLFTALFCYMQHLGRRGCHRTAMEVCKILLSLDLDDPVGAKLCIDYYALRAGQYTWLQSFVERFYEDQTVALLPNFSFSLAIARFYVEQKEEPGPNDEAVPSSDLLQQALMLHPSVLKKIVVRAPIKEDVEWAKVLKHPHFAKATSGGPSLEHLINIYIERNYLLWRSPGLQSWLKAAAEAVCKNSDGEAATWACARAEAFQADHNEYQHLSVSEFSDTASAIPPLEELDAAALAPPAAGRQDAVELGARNPLAVFVESLLPWTNYGGGLAEEESDA